MQRKKRIVEDWTGQLHMLPGPKLIEAEKDTQEKIRLAVASAGGVMVMRNNVGVARHGKRMVRYGLGTGSSDLVCVVAPYGRFLGLEIKRPKGGVVSVDQKKWMQWIQSYGGVAGVATTVEEALELVARARRPAEA